MERVTTHANTADAVSRNDLKFAVAQGWLIAQLDLSRAYSILRRIAADSEFAHAEAHGLIIQDLKPQIDKQIQNWKPCWLSPRACTNGSQQAVCLSVVRNSQWLIPRACTNGSHWNFQRKTHTYVCTLSHFAKQRQTCQAGSLLNGRYDRWVL